MQKLQKWNQEFSLHTGPKQFLQKHYVPFENNYQHNCDTQTGNDALSIQAVNGVQSNKNSDPKNIIKNDEDQQKDADQLQILTIKECLHDSRLSIASILLSSEQVTLDKLSSEEQCLWNSYDNAYIYKFLTGEKDTIPDFQFDWITLEPAVRLSANFQDFLTSQPEQKPPQQPPPLPVQQAHPQVQPQQPPVPPTPPTAPASDRVLRDKVPVDYRELHTGNKKKCKSLRRKAQAEVTKLAPGAFSPKRDGGGPSTSTSQQ